MSTCNTDGLAAKLNCLKEKFARYNCHKNLLSCSIDEKLSPKGLELTIYSLQLETMNKI